MLKLGLNADLSFVEWNIVRKFFSENRHSCLPMVKLDTLLEDVKVGRNPFNDDLKKKLKYSV